MSKYRGPERLWLQPEEGEDGTWCRDQIHEDDVEYVRADIAQEASAASPVLAGEAPFVGSPDAEVVSPPGAPEVGEPGDFDALLARIRHEHDELPEEDDVGPDEALRERAQAVIDIAEAYASCDGITSEGKVRLRNLLLEWLARPASPEIARLRAWVDDLQSGMWVNCVYCGHRYGPGETTPVSMADALKEHVEQCPEHPMSALRAELDALRASPAGAEEREP